MLSLRACPLSGSRTGKPRTSTNVAEKGARADKVSLCPWVCGSRCDVKEQYADEVPRAVLRHRCGAEYVAQPPKVETGFPVSFPFYVGNERGIAKELFFLVKLHCGVFIFASS